MRFFLNLESIDKNYMTSPYFIKKLDENIFLLTTEHGAWCVLSSEELELFRSGKVYEDIELYNKLESLGIIITSNNVHDLINRYRFCHDNLFKGIIFHVIAPTNRCNQKCLYCYSNSTPNSTDLSDMDRDTARAVVDFLIQTPATAFTIEFQGGEPLLNYSIVQEIMEYSKDKVNATHLSNDGWWLGKKNISFVLGTNLTLMDYDILRYLQNNKVIISTSLDGPRELHDKNRPWNKGSSYEKVIYWIDVIKNNFKYERINAYPTITRYSFEFHPREIVEEYLNLGFNHFFLKYMNIAGRAALNWNKIGYYPEEYFDYWKKHIEFLLKLNLKGIFFYEDMCASMLQRTMTVKPPIYTLHTCLNNPCGACTLQCAYDPSGNIYPCDEARSFEIFMIGNVRENNYIEVFTSNEARTVISLTYNKSKLCSNCSWSPYCNTCMVTTYGSSGNIIPILTQDFICRLRGKQWEYLFRKMVSDHDAKKIFNNWLRVILSTANFDPRNS